MMNSSKYFTNVKPRLFEIAAWARDGTSEKEMAERCYVPYSSWKTYKKEHKELGKALKEHKEIFDIKLENAFFRRCLGYSYEEDTKELVKDSESGEEKLIIVKKVKKEIPPDVNALKFALANRMKDKYADKQQIDLGNKDDKPFEVKQTQDLSKLSLEEKKSLLSLIQKVNTNETSD